MKCGLFYVQIGSLYAHFLESYYHKWMLDFFLKLSLHLLRSVDLWILKNSCITWMNPTWSCYVVPLRSCWNWFATVWLRILCLCSSLILPCNFLFWWHICLLVVSGWWWPHRMNLRSVLSSASFWNSFWRIGIDSSPNAWQNLPLKSSGPGLLFSGKF